MLHNIRSVHNVGSIFRTADAAGVTKIILVGYTPTPLDRFGRARKDFAKVSLGAENTVVWEQVETFAEAVTKVKEAGCTVVALEQDAASVPLFEYKTPTKNIALVLGSEVEGILKSELALCDAVVEIPMHGTKESLNVSVAAGIALFSLLK
ncbi:MAG: TrmH family RNA methyltransferase [Candidatus Adlerbacteria bacterium]|nr:TrmH family RNA methyltransferase [Candidatus Adlerbacteria bacterium]